MAEAPRSRYFIDDAFEGAEEEDDDVASITVQLQRKHHRKRWGSGLCRRPWWQQVSIYHHHRTCTSSAFRSSSSPNFPPRLSILLRGLSISRRRLSFEPHSKLYFPYEPGKQCTSAVRMKNISHDCVAFKFQTTAPKSCFMRPPNGVLHPGESIIAIVVKFIELAKSIEQEAEYHHHIQRKTRDKFKIVTLKMEDGVEFTPELFDEQKGFVVAEQILQVVLLDPSQPSPQLKKLNGLIEEETAAQDARTKLLEQKPPLMSNINDINVLEEWKQRKLARKQVK